jgi:hypothetical protein
MAFIYASREAAPFVSEGTLDESSPPADGAAHSSTAVAKLRNDSEEQQLRKVLAAIGCLRRGSQIAA